MDASKLTLADVQRIIESKPEEEVSLESLNRKVDAFVRKDQSGKDRAIAKTNQRIDELKSELKLLRRDFEELKEILVHYLEK